MQIRLAHHFIDIALKFRRHFARLLDEAGNSLDRHGQILRANGHQSYHANQCDFGPVEVEHESLTLLRGS